MDKAVVFMKSEALVHQLIENGVPISDLVMQVSPLMGPSPRFTIFISSLSLKAGATLQDSSPDFVQDSQSGPVIMAGLLFSVDKEGRLSINS